MEYKDLIITPFKGQKATARDAEKWCRMSVDMPRIIRTAIAGEARKARCSASELCRAIITDWLERNGSPMSEAVYKEELDKAKYFMKCDTDNSDFWRGYAFGLHRGHDDGFDEDKHEARLADEFALGDGYRTGILCFQTGLKWEV